METSPPEFSLLYDDTALLIMRDTESALDFTEEIKEMLR